MTTPSASLLRAVRERLRTSDRDHRAVLANELLGRKKQADFAHALGFPEFDSALLWYLHRDRTPAEVLSRLDAALAAIEKETP
jgi:hypothetical protein